MFGLSFEKLLLLPQSSLLNLRLHSITSCKLHWKLVMTIQVFPFSTLQTRHFVLRLYSWLGKKVSNSSSSLTRHKNKILQYKLLNLIIYTNKSLHKMKLFDSPGLSGKILTNLFCRCNFSAAFWKSVVPWLKTLHIDFHCDSFSGCDIFFGMTHWLLLNNNIIDGKQIIYYSRLKNSLPTLSHLII